MNPHLYSLSYDLENATNSGGIQNNLEIIVPLIAEIEEQHPDILQEAVNLVKDAIQKEANASIADQKFTQKRGLLAMATGSGKSRVPILQILEDYKKGNSPRVLIIVPTQKLRDTGWKEEFYKWGAQEIYDRSTTTTCYASLHKLVGQAFEYVIGDEFHNLNDVKAESLSQIFYEYMYALTATPPRDKVKLQLLNSLGIKTTYKLPLDTAVLLRLVSPFKITIVEVDLDNKDKCIESGNKNLRFLVTEAQHYQYIDSKAEAAKYSRNPFGAKLAIFNRMNVIKNLQCKQKATKFILDNLLPESEYRTLIFAGSIDQAIDLCEYTYFSKPSYKKTDPAPKRAKVEYQLSKFQGEASYEMFCKLEINRMACVDKLNEGANLPGLDAIVAAHLNSQDTDFIQRVGRLIRYRIGHIGQVIIILAKKTKDADWVNSAIESIDPTKIRRIQFTDLVSGKEQLLI